MQLTKWTSIALFIGASLLAGAALVQDQDPEAGLFDPGESGVSKEMMERARGLSQPGPEHELLAKYAGEFDQEIRMWMTPSTKDPMVIRAEVVNTMILDGRFLKTESPTQLGIMGFDRRCGEFTTIGFDRMGTYSVAGQGPRGEDGKIVMYGEDYDAVFEATQKYNFVMSFIDDDSYMVQIIFVDTNHGNTDPFKMVEVVNTRKAE